MTTQTIKQKIIFKEKTQTNYYVFPPRELREIEKLINHCGQYYSKDFILGRMEQKWKNTYNVVEEKIFEGSIFPVNESNIEKLKISYHNKQHKIDNYYFDADEGCLVMEVVVKTNFLIDSNLVEMEAAVDEFIAINAEVLEKNMETIRRFNESQQKKNRFLWWKK